MNTYPTAKTLEIRLATELRTRRLEAGLSSAELAAKIGVSPMVLVRIENGLLPLTAGTAFLLGQALDCNINSLMRFAFEEALGSAA